MNDEHRIAVSKRFWELDRKALKRIKVCPHECCWPSSKQTMLQVRVRNKLIEDRKPGALEQQAKRFMQESFHRRSWLVFMA